jgi:rfaE bifunctional protein kinase chain/domain
MVKMGRFHRFRPFKALVIGDFLLDRYTTGRVGRISPEAPVPVMEVFSEESKAGGAGNAALNLIALGGFIFAMGRIGPDARGSELKERLDQKGVDTSSLFIEKQYKTAVKNRFIADSQQLLRVDFETVCPLEPETEQAALEQLKRLVPLVDVIALSDYGKGFLSDALIQSAIALGKHFKIPTIIDPKGLDFFKYRGATILKPNLSEAYAAAKMPRTASLDLVARQLLELSQVEYLLITRSEAGISLFNQEGQRTDFPVRSKEVKDVTGAGDTVLAVMSLALAHQLDLPFAIHLANIAAGLSIERLGCAQIYLSEIAERFLEYHGHFKIFDESHASALHQALQHKSYSLLVLEKEQQVSFSLFRAIRTLGALPDKELIVYIKSCDPEDEWVSLLASLKEVRAIILQEENLQHLYEAMHPDQIYFLEGEALYSRPLDKPRHRKKQPIGPV